MCRESPDPAQMYTSLRDLIEATPRDTTPLWRRRRGNNNDDDVSRLTS